MRPMHLFHRCAAAHNGPGVGADPYAHLRQPAVIANQINAIESELGTL